eukprot:3119403-Lingulodinium_polyedra.AAC.1
MDEGASRAGPEVDGTVAVRAPPAPAAAWAKGTTARSSAPPLPPPSRPPSLVGEPERSAGPGPAVEECSPRS